MSTSSNVSPKTQLREDLFVAAIVAGETATHAAEAAGYSTKSAAVRGHELMQRPRVQAAIQRSKERIARKFKVTAERVVEEMAVIGFSDIRHFQITDDGHVALAANAPDSAMRAVKRIKRKVRIIPVKNAAAITEYDTELELWNKDTELRHLGEYLKLFKEKRAEDDDTDDELTVEQRKERIISILRVAAKRRAARKRAG